jgi:hypothetical protein
MQGLVKVAPARWWHVPGLSRLIRETRRRRSGGPAPGEALLWSPHWSPSLGLLQSVWTDRVPGVIGPRSFVAESGPPSSARPVGLAQMRPRGEPHQWEVVYLALTRPAGAAPAAGADGPGPAILRPPEFVPFRSAPDRRAAQLLGELCDAGVELGAERIFASIPEGGGCYELFKQVGFSSVVREYDYYRPPQGAPGLPAEAPAIEGLRPQRRSDAFGLLQLYQACTPKLVQMAEGKRSRSWDLPAPGWGRRLARGRAESRRVVERDARKVAWLRLGRLGRGAHAVLLVQMLVDPRASDLIEPLLQVALAATAAQPAGGILVRLREHQQGLMGALEANGFGQLESRLLMVKQLAALVRHPQFVPALEKVV